MMTEIDEGKGLVKTSWANVRKRVAKVNPPLAALVDKINPDKGYPLYLAYYPYGSITGDTETPFLPKMDGTDYRLSDPNAPKDVVNDLGYGLGSCPFGMLLEKNLEYFADLKNEYGTIPWAIISPGTFFPLTRIFCRKEDPFYTPNKALTTTAGARSIFMLPNIGCATNHANLKRDYNIHSTAPKMPYDQWHTFKEIVSAPISNCNWRSCILYFSKKWVDKILNDKTWISIKTYLLETAWRRFEYDRNRIYYDIAFSLIQKKRCLKPNPYLADTARHLFAVILSAAPGYVPATNDDLFPLDILTKAYVESYGLQYTPTVMQPSYFTFENSNLPIYYSLQTPSTYIFSPKARKTSSTLSEMRELEHIMKIFVNELSKGETMCADAIITEAAKAIELKYYHSEFDKHKVLFPSKELPYFDERFNYTVPQYKKEPAKFSSDGRFVRGCISIRRKKEAPKIT